jgi:NADH-ubiquinone oxidoreductase chain 1
MTEHAAGIFVFFFLAEYASIILICILITIVFLGGYEILGLIDTALQFVLPIIFIIYSFIDTLFENIINIFSNKYEVSQVLYNIKDEVVSKKVNLDNISAILSNNNVLSILYPLNLGIKSFSLVFLFILIRASYPRLRFDKLMSCC